MKNVKSIKTICLDLALIFAGSVLCAVAIKGILVPKQFLAVGITGQALLIFYVLPILPVGVIYFVLNTPLFIVGWLFVRRRFFLYSIAGGLIFSGAMLLPFPIIKIYDMILAALTAGIQISPKSIRPQQKISPYVEKRIYRGPHWQRVDD